MYLRGKLFLLNLLSKRPPLTQFVHVQSERDHEEKEIEKYLCNWMKERRINLSYGPAMI